MIHKIYLGSVFLRVPSSKPPACELYITGYLMNDSSFNYFEYCLKLCFNDNCIKTLVKLQEQTINKVLRKHSYFA